MSFFDDQDNAERLRVMEQRAAQKDAAKVSIDNLAARYPDESQDIPQPSPSPLTRRLHYTDYGEGERVEEFYEADAVDKALAQQAQEIERLTKTDAMVRKWHAEAAKDCVALGQQLAAMTTERDEAVHERDRTNYENAHANQRTRETLFAGVKERDIAIQQLQATLAAREAEIVKIKAELNETWIDERETVWTRPTAWAYAMVCKARDNKEAERDAAVREAGRLRARLAEMEGEA